MQTVGCLLQKGAKIASTNPLYRNLCNHTAVSYAKIVYQHFQELTLVYKNDHVGSRSLLMDLQSMETSNVFLYII